MNVVLVREPDGGNDETRNEDTQDERGAALLVKRRGNTAYITFQSATSTAH
jgi:hypothetical protein